MDATRNVLGRARATLDVVAEELAARVAVVPSAGNPARLGSLDPIAPEAFALARNLAQVTAAETLLDWGERHGELERDLARAYAIRAGADVLGKPLFDLVDTAWLAGLGTRVAQAGAGTEAGGARGLSEEHQALRDALARFARDKLGPLAESIHREDKLVPEEVLRGLADLGVFGISIPEEFGGCFSDHTAMIVATEALSESSLGAGGSVITRPEICAKALLAGGSPEQKQRWLPRIASGERMVCVAVSEPDAGSDVAALRLRAAPAQGGYLLNGEKTWCTFAGRADLLILLARTGAPEDGHRGLSLFLVEKPATRAGEGDEYGFEHREGSGAIRGRAIPTVGYRGMHSFSVSFEDWFVPDANRIGEEGQGFYLTMKGFVGGRMQTAARAVGVMQAALESAIRYANERVVFGRPLAELTLTRCKLAEMAARVQAGRQLAYAVAALLDRGEGEREASLVKLLTCRDAEWVTREAMQLHGGMGYSEEYAVSRYWLDARVLSIFEGAEEVLALRVVARGLLRERLAEPS